MPFVMFFFIFCGQIFLLVTVRTFIHLYLSIIIVRKDHGVLTLYNYDFGIGYYLDLSNKKKCNIHQAYSKVNDWFIS
jgi:hypothetical protein